MTGRLTEEALVQSLDKGWQSLVWKSQFKNKNSQLAPHVDFKSLLDAKDPQSAVQEVPRRDMYLELVAQGPEDALDILPLLSQEQFIAIIDNEAWHDGKLAVHQAIRWLDLYRNLSPEQFYKRYRELDEEYQVAILNPYIDLKDQDEFETLPQEEQDKFTALPCNTMWWRVKDGDERVTEFVTALIEASIGEDAAYVYTLLGMASSMPPNEQEHLLKQFRDARLEEDGFVTQEESLALFLPFDGAALYEKWKRIVGSCDKSAVLVEQNASELFLDQVLRQASASGQADHVAIESVQRGFAYLANAVSAASQVEPDDVHGLTALLTQVRSLVSFGLEVLSEGSVATAVDVLFTEHPKNLFRFALSVADSVRLLALSGLKGVDAGVAPKIEALWKSGKFGSAQMLLEKVYLDHLGFEATETLKGIFNRFPLVKSEVIEADGVSRIRFKPMETVADFSVSMSMVQDVFPSLKQGAFQ
jgi:hypothetical protein